ncbi:ABC transporter ATP-binding protein [Erysipelotrichaceae bacterium OH741_COT-311]|nr:ABC transporter ATP-binding protein [Erysipelotrichaceae bacterium OH741_COT-311]
MSAIVKFEHVSKDYQKKTIIEDFDLEIEEGSFLVIIGSSGSGKTTIMKMINGLVLPSKGNVYVQGKDVLSQDLIALRRSIGYAIQGNVLFPHLTIKENIAYVLNLLKKDQKEIDEVVLKSLRLLNLPEDVLHRYPSQLSGGQNQRVNIARALSNQPRILLMDEPFGALDAIVKYQLQRDLKKMHQELKNTIVFITHDIHEALKLATHILVMDQGKIQQYATVKEIVEKPANAFVAQLLNMACKEIV